MKIRGAGYRNRPLGRRNEELLEEAFFSRLIRKRTILSAILERRFKGNGVFIMERELGI